MKISSLNKANRGPRAFKFFIGDDVTESAMMDDERKSDDEWDDDSLYSRYSGSNAGTV